MDPTEKQIGMLSYLVRSEMPDALPDVHEGEANVKYVKLGRWAKTLDRYQLSSLINIVSDEGLSPEFRSEFFTRYLEQKNYDEA